MISVIMPTMWKSNLAWKTIRELMKQPAVGEFILIDNSEEDNGNKPFARNFSPNLVYIEEGKNTYVNPAWNKGARLAKFDKLLFVNDDVETDWSFVNNLEEYITEYRGMIGAGVSCWQGPHKNSDVVPIAHRPNCYGCVFAIHKDSYVEIPDDLKIHYGDDWLFTKSGKPNYEIRGWKMSGESEQTSGLEKFNPVKERDKELWFKNYQQ